MENKINKKVETYIEDFREALRDKIVNLNVDKEMQATLLETLYSIKTLQLNKEDFMKRKRIVSTIPVVERCTAKKANGEQCTRKKKEGYCFCGTHDKYQPHGVVNILSNEKTKKKITLTIVDINGINYYIDEEYNVYNTAHILSNNNNPEIIAKAIYKDNKYELITN